MTREEAIAHGKEQLEVFSGEHAEFIKLAIKALEQEPCEDAVSRQYIIEKFNEINRTAELDRLFEVVEKAPPVTYAKLEKGENNG